MANYPHPKKGSRHSAGTGYQSGVRRQLREDRQVQARVRQELYDKLSPTEKLARLGNLTAAKQRVKLSVQFRDETIATAQENRKARKEKRA